MRRIPAIAVLALSAGCAGVAAEEPVDLPVEAPPPVVAVEVVGGLMVLVPGGWSAPWRLQYRKSSGWVGHETSGDALAPGTRLFVPGGGGDAVRIVAGDRSGPAAEVVPSGLWVRLEGPFLPRGGDALDLAFGAASVIDGVAGIVEIDRVSAGEDGDEVEQMQFVVSDLGAPLGLAPWPVRPDAPRSETARVRMRTTASDGTEVIVAEVEAAVVTAGPGLVWGDLHGHSNLSWDGCEGEDCGLRVDEAAGDYFEQARHNGLDFAALTDHAEYAHVVTPDGRVTDIWAAQNAAVQAADAGGFVPLLGYEWTRRIGSVTAEDLPFAGGHKTVVLEEPAACEAYRVGAEGGWVTQRRPDGTQYVVRAEGLVASPTELWAALRAAAEACPRTNALTWYHHGTADKPQSVDWRHSGNAPDPAIERVVEVYSAHGAFECANLDSEGCDWRIRDQEWPYHGAGSVQSALRRGLALGFVAGSDCHDGRPGRVGPPGAHWSASGPHSQYTQGGVTGVWLGGPLDRSALFAAIGARHTVATSGFRGDIRVVGVDGSGRAFLPGAAVDALPIVVHASVDIEGAEAAYLELVTPGNDVLAATNTGVLVGEVHGTAYLRGSVWIDGVEERLWVSPFFAP